MINTERLVKNSSLVNTPCIFFSNVYVRARIKGIEIFKIEMKIGYNIAHKFK